MIAFTAIESPYICAQQKVRNPSVSQATSSGCKAKTDSMEERIQSQQNNQPAWFDSNNTSVSHYTSSGYIMETNSMEENTEIGRNNSNVSAMETDSINNISPRLDQNKSNSSTTKIVDAWSFDDAEINLITLSNNDDDVDSEDCLFDTNDSIVNFPIDQQCLKASLSTETYNMNDFRNTYDGRMGVISGYKIELNVPAETFVCIASAGSTKSVRSDIPFTTKLSIKDPNVIIWDSAATINLIKNINLFKGKVKRLLPTDQLNICGFDSSFGFGLATGVGYLKWPMEGVKAYYSEQVIGNIISEKVMREKYLPEYVSERSNLW